MINFKIEKIRYPYVTSKVRQHIYGNQKKGRKYCFIVDSYLKKESIKTCLEKFFNVTITKINIINRPPKKKRIGKYYGYKKNHKKVIIQLKKNQNIKYFYDL
uniref:Ribosomal protein L23 n=1 Tax=Nitzschia sp. PL3-2 TaxID=2083271 RepID=A0A2Z5ZAV8_9STRA|nr:ribosomal protein L23 [Nitzschia sp. PL3-2]